MALPKTDELLARIPLFAGLSKKGLREVSSLATRLNLSEGRELTHQGGPGNEFIVVIVGTVDVIIDGKVVTTCGAGDFFGEIALLEGRRRTATVVAKTDVVVDVIGRPEFSALLADQPQIETQLRDVMAQRLAEDEARQGEDTTP
jgi:CRP-like cAMP-binding protein